MSSCNVEIRLCSHIAPFICWDEKLELILPCKILWLFRFPSGQTRHLFLIKEFLVVSGQLLPALWLNYLDQVLMRPGPGVQFPHRPISFAFLHVPGLYYVVSPGCLKMLPSILQYEPLVIKGASGGGGGGSAKPPHWLKILNLSCVAQGKGSKATRKRGGGNLGRSRTRRQEGGVHYWWEELYLRWGWLHSAPS